ncbi:unnamed protein product [Brassica rapa subsp. narinosa]
MGNVLKPLTEDPLSFAYEPLLSSPSWFTYLCFKSIFTYSNNIKIRRSICIKVDKENEDLRVFSVTELKKATNNFRKDRVVHEEDGSVRTFYKGSIDDTSSRTKKRISVFVMECLQDSLEAIEAWKEEVKSLGEHSHPNIVTFLGYCCEDKKSLLVFEYLHQGTLDHHINGKKEVLSWETRVKIAIGIAKGVAFLHSFYNSSLYFELRMHNIMLDEEYNAKLFYLETDKKCLENCLTIYGHRYMPHECLVSEEAENENLRVFSVKELKKATKKFKKERVVEGEDTYVQTFYKGNINQTTSAPSKTKTRIDVSVMEGLLYTPHGLEEWKISKEEAESLGEIFHPNLVKLLGYCSEDNRSLLVFEYLGKEKEETLSWDTRVKIAIGIAQGVAFLHSIKNSPLHQELRMHNIMLDEQYNAKLLYLDSKKQFWPIGWTFVGTIYMSLEYLEAATLGMETDVYTFGVILLELFTGSKEISIYLKRLRTRTILFAEIIDPRLGSHYPVNAATKMGKLIQRCTKDNWKKRPSMQQVLDVLNSICNSIRCVKILKPKIYRLTSSPFSINNGKCSKASHRRSSFICLPSSPQPTIVTELKKATKNFKKDSVVQGEDGSVRTFYKGSIDDTTSRTKTRISVSVMECVQDSLEAIEAWKEEVKSLGKHSHPNIVKFLGYCCEDKKSLLVFEYLHKGTLDHHFQGKNEVLSWATRVKIAIGIAQGVAFLHSINNSSLYFELRMHNIMLDEEYNAKLFYLETDKTCLEKELRVVRGIEYMTPERLRTGRFEMDSDVFTFGIILLELFTGLKDRALLPPLIALRDGSKKLEDESLDIRTRPFLFNEVIDPRLEGDYPVTAVMQMGTLIQRCTEDRHTRPSMQQVLDVLNHIAEIHSYRYEFSCC